MSAPVLTLVGGPTALIEASGFRLLTDPTFDASGEYKTAACHAEKTCRDGPRTPAEVEQVDAVLLSHDQHVDNFDHFGKARLGTAICLNPASTEQTGCGSNSVKGKGAQ